MTFYSVLFIIFAAAAALVYFVCPKRFRWVILLIAGYIFYFTNSHWLLLVHLVTALFTWGIGLWMGRINAEGRRSLEKNPDLSRDEKKKIRGNTKSKTQKILWLGIIVDLGTLLFLKYWNFFVGRVNPLLSHIGLQAPNLGLLMPLGISFYTLQALAYMIDIYRGKIEPDRNPFKFMLFMSFFPQIVQGPISRYSQLAGQLYEGHSFDLRRVGFGFQLMLWGWFKKLVIADRIAIPITGVIDHQGTYHGPIIFFAFALYGIQIYTDFSGGIDIASGFAQILGIDLAKNFEQPYFSRSIEEFWRRWHITLGSWMRDYVFYPLSLSRAFTKLGKASRKIFGTGIGKKIPSFLAMFIVYILVGMWHGSSFNFIAYGLWNGMFIMMSILLEEVYARARGFLEIDADSFGHHLFQITRTFVLITFGRYFSRSAGFNYALRLFHDTFTNWKDLSFLLNGTLIELGLNTANWFLLCAAILVLFVVDLLHERNVHLRESLSRQHVMFRWLVYTAAILSILIFGIYGPGYDATAFIYEQF